MIKPRRSHIESRMEFERNLNLLGEYMFSGKLKINRDMETISRLKNGFMSARKLPNKRIDFVTINESVRLMANTVAQPFFRNKNQDEE